MHDLPAHPGEEISAEVLYGSRQRIWDQAENRRHAQKALLELLVAPRRTVAGMTLDPRVARVRQPTPRPTALSQLAAPAARRRAGAEIDSLAFGGEGVARLGDGGYVVFVAGRDPGRSRARGRAQAQAQLRARPRRRGARAQPRADRAARRPSGRALAGAPLRAPASGQAHAGRRRAAADRPARRVRAGGDRARAGAVALPQQARVLLRGRTSRRRSWCAAFTPRPGGNAVVAIEDCLLASERGNLAREVALRWCRAQGLTAWERGGGRGRARLARARRRARASGRGPAPDGRACLRNLVVREGRRTGQAADPHRHDRRRARGGRARAAR